MTYMIPLTFALLNLETVEREKITKIWISRERKEIFRRKKTFFIVFKGLSFSEKIKIWLKIADTSFKYVWPKYVWRFSRHQVLKG